MNSVGVVRSLSRSFRDSEAAHQIQDTLENIKEDQYYQQRSEILLDQNESSTSIQGNGGISPTLSSHHHHLLPIQPYYLLDNELKREYASSWFQQVYLLSHRTLLNNFRNPYLLKTQYIMTLGIGLLVGIIYWHVTDDLPGVQNRAGSLFFMISLLTFGSMSSIDICK
jgi:hypothetical protein